METCIKCGREIYRRVCKKCKTDQTTAAAVLVKKVCMEKDLHTENGYSSNPNLITAEMVGKFQLGKYDYQKAMEKQMEWCKAVCAMIREAFACAEGKDQIYVKNRMYHYVLTTAKQLCETSEALFGRRTNDCRWWREAGKRLLDMEMIDREQYRIGMIRRDKDYRMMAGNQVICAVLLKQELDAQVIRENEEYRKLTLELAQAFNAMWQASTERYRYWELSPPVRLVDLNWEMYECILEGLYQGEIASLDERGWLLALGEIEKSQENTAYKKEFLRRRDEKRSALREKEDEDYWQQHPKEKGQYKTKKERAEKIQVHILERSNEIACLEEQVKQTAAAIVECEDVIWNKKYSIEKLNKKLFGKKRAQEQIEVLEQEIAEQEQQIKELEAKIDAYKKTRGEKSAQKLEMEAKVCAFQAEMDALRHLK